RRQPDQSQLLLDFFQSCGLALQLSQVIKLRAAHFARPHHANLVNDLRIEREDSFNALAETDLANRKAWLRAPAARDDYALEGLQSFFLAFANLHLHPNRVAWSELRQVSAACFRQQFFDNCIAHNVSFLTRL